LTLEREGSWEEKGWEREADWEGDGEMLNEADCEVEREADWECSWTRTKVEHRAKAGSLACFKPVLNSRILWQATWG
jgi:hypothetical protein